MTHLSRHRCRSNAVRWMSNLIAGNLRNLWQQVLPGKIAKASRPEMRSELQNQPATEVRRQASGCILAQWREPEWDFRIK